MEWRVTPPKPVTSPTWSAPQPHADKKLTCLLLCLLCRFKFQTLTCYRISDYVEANPA